MRLESFALTIPVAADSGGAGHVADHFTAKTVLVSGVFTGTLRVQGSLDGTNYHDVGSVTAPGVIVVEETVRYLRVYKAAGFTGTPACSFGGMNTRVL